MESLGMIHILHQGEESYNNMWQKVRSIWAYIYMHYLNDYDYFHLGGDDLYVIVENLKRFLVEQQELQASPDEPRFFGAWIDRPGKEAHYVAGAPGYTLNRAALKRFVEEALLMCRANQQTAAEDRMLSRCFQNDLKIEMGDTRDCMTGEQLYHDCDPNHLYITRASKQKGSSSHASAAAYWETLPHPMLPNTTVGPKLGLDTAARYSVSLHNIFHPIFVARLHALIYKSICPATSNLGRALRAQDFVKDSLLL
jgi:glycoprotein-N-acetylgalactosamine 3-beta-galactosyltransferase